MFDVFTTANSLQNDVNTLSSETIGVSFTFTFILQNQFQLPILSLRFYRFKEYFTVHIFKGQFLKLNNSGVSCFVENNVVDPRLRYFEIKCSEFPGKKYSVTGQLLNSFQ